MSDAYTPQSALLARLLQQQQETPVRSIGQGIANVLGDIGTGYFDKKNNDAMAAALAQAMATAANTGTTNGQAAVQGMPYTAAQPAFPNGAPQVPGAGGPPSGPMPVAQDSGINNTLNPQARGLAALYQLTKANPQMAAQYGPQVLELAKQATPHVNYQNTGGQLTPFDEYGNVAQGVKPIPVGMSPSQQAQFDIERGNLDVSRKREAFEESKSGWVDTKDALGNPISYNRETGEVKAPKGVAADTAETVGPMAKGIANYDLAPLSSVAMLKPFGQAVMAEVMKQNPDYDAKFYNSAKSAKQSFASGKNGQLTRQANTATSHLMTLQALGAALDSGDVNIVNSLKNRLSSEFGNVPIAGYDAAAKVVGDEVNKFISGGPGAASDRNDYAAVLSNARSGPQREAAINSLKGLMVGQLRALQRQYETETRSKDFGDKLEPEVAAMIGNPQYATGVNPTVATPAPAPGGQPGAAPAVRVYNPKTGRLE